MQRPLEHGFDIVMHSATKYLNGHSDMVGGMLVVGENAELRERLTFLQNAVGAIAGPFDSFLALARPEDPGACAWSAIAAMPWPWPACWRSIPRSRRSSIPASRAIPSTSWRKRQMHGFGGMVTAILKGSLDDARRFLERCEIFALAESLGGVESLIEHPAIMTHASLPPEVRAALGIGDGLVRLSVGVEDEVDLLEELQAALG